MKRIFINNQQADILESEKVGYTKQVNSLKDLSSRQTNFSKSFKIPKTAKNIQIFKGLGMPGSGSDLPFAKNQCRLFIGNLCLVYEGFLKILQTTNQYEVCIYDGNIDFFTKLDNIKFEDLDLSELSHLKTVAEIKDNWENGNQYYSYLFADYNGKISFDNGGTSYFNTDYLVPAVPIKFLWERIFSTFGFTFSGTIFTDPEYLETYLTYPKGVVSGDVGDHCVTIDFENQKMISYTFQEDPPIWLLWDYFNYSTQIDQGAIVSNSTNTRYKSWQVPENGYYNIAITGYFHPMAKKGVDSYFYLAFDIEDLPIDDVRNSLDEAIMIVGGSGEFTIEDHFSPLNKYLYAGQTITFIYDKAASVQNDNTILQFNAVISRIDQTAIDQFEFFKGLTPKDFYKEVMWRFGLTPFSSKDSDHIEFLTYEERINAPVLDWSSKYVRRISEKYVFDGYAKSNFFRFKYNEEEEDHNDGVIFIENENLPEKTDVIKSKTYSVENSRAFINLNSINYDFPKIKLWEKEVKEDQGQTVIEYKSQDSRFTFLRKRDITESMNIGSEQLGQFDTVSKVVAASNANYSFQQVIENRYRPIRSLFNKTRIITIEVMLSQIEFDEFDMKPVLYFEQEGGTFMVDKFGKRDLESKLTQIDLIKINR